ncbi:MAG: hypothetical protein M1839_005913 [Geoglossum umbratile]|nr:MAG: hypothetical protein M1839_005913 [Geoglossum umbratile]
MHHSTFQQETRFSLDSIQEQVNQARLQNELRAERDRVTQHQEREDERQWRREDKEEERQRRHEEQEQQRQRRLEEEKMRRQHTAWQSPIPQQFLPPYGQHQHQLPYTLPPQIFPQIPSHMAASSILPLQPASSVQQQIPSRVGSRTSSPISTRLDDAEVLEAFFRRKARSAKSMEQAEKWARVGDIVRDQDWSIGDLKAMESGTGVMYTSAVTVGISDRFARCFASELRAYKSVRRRTEAEAELLQGGSFGVKSCIYI